MFGRISEKLLNLAWNRRVGRYRKEFPEIDMDFTFHPGSRVYGMGRAVFGARSYLNRDSSVQVAEGVTVSIGEATRIGPGVRIYSTTTDPDADASREPVPSRSADVTIGDFVWIGAGAYIGPGVDIGDNAVIGANSVVTRDVKQAEIVGGVPARRIRFKKEFQGHDQAT